MKRSYCFAIVILLTGVTLNAFWSDFRSSSYTPQEEIFFQYESELVNDTEHLLFYFSDDLWHGNSMDLLTGNTFQGAAPFSNIENLALSLRIETPEEIHIILGYSAEQPSDPLEMVILSEYEVNPDIPNHLNIAGERMLFNEDTLFFAFHNFGGGFPTNGGTVGPFYSYTINLWPEAETTTQFVYVLLYTIDLAPFINPGLYKIDALTQEMDQIGSVSYQVDADNNTLFLSCLWEDLINDPDFADNYSSGEPLVVSSLTQKIEDFGQTITIMDEGDYHKIVLRKLLLEPFVNNIPEIDNIVVEQDNEHTGITLDYFDQDGHFPLIAEIELDSGYVTDFLPASFDFSDTVSFNCQFNNQWSQATLRFSDNYADFVEYSIFNTSVDEEVLSPQPDSFSLFPNPFSASDTGNQYLNLRIETYEQIKIEIFNLKGQKLFKQQESPVMNDKASIPSDLLATYLPASGVYLIRISPAGSRSSKMGERPMKPDPGMTGKFLYIK